MANATSPTMAGSTQLKTSSRRFLRDLLEAATSGRVAASSVPNGNRSSAVDGADQCFERSGHYVRVYADAPVHGSASSFDLDVCGGGRINARAEGVFLVVDQGADDSALLLESVLEGRKWAVAGAGDRSLDAVDGDGCG